MRFRRKEWKKKKKKEKEKKEQRNVFVLQPHRLWLPVVFGNEKKWREKKNHRNHAHLLHTPIALLLVAVCFYCCCLLFLHFFLLLFSFFHLFHFVSFVRWDDTKCFEKNAIQRMVKKKKKVKLVNSRCIIRRIQWKQIRNWVYTGSQTKINGINIVDERKKNMPESRIKR